MLVGAIGLLAGDRADAVRRPPGGRGGHRAGPVRAWTTMSSSSPGSCRGPADPAPTETDASSPPASSPSWPSGLVDLHAQHAHVGLLTTVEPAAGPRSLRRRRPRRARSGPGGARAGGARRWRSWAATRRARDRERDFLRYQLDEIDGAGLTDEGEDDRLLAEESILGGRRCPPRRRGGGRRSAQHRRRRARPGRRGARGARWPSAVRADRRSPPLGRSRARRRRRASLRALAEGIEGDPERLALVQERRARLADLRRRYVGDGAVVDGRPLRRARGAVDPTGRAREPRGSGGGGGGRPR